MISRGCCLKNRSHKLKKVSVCSTEGVSPWLQGKVYTHKYQISEGV